MTHAPWKSSGQVWGQVQRLAHLGVGGPERAPPKPNRHSSSGAVAQLLVWMPKSQKPFECQSSSPGTLSHPLRTPETSLRNNRIFPYRISVMHLNVVHQTCNNWSDLSISISLNLILVHFHLKMKEREREREREREKEREREREGDFVMQSFKKGKYLG